MGRWRDKMVNGPLGIPPFYAERMQRLLEPGEELRYAFVADTNVNWRTWGLFMLSRGTAIRTIGRVYVVITNRCLLLVDTQEQWLGAPGDRVVYRELPVPATFGPVSGNGWILLNREPVQVPGGRKVIDRAEAALKGLVA